MSDELGHLMPAAVSLDAYERGAASEQLARFADQPNVAAVLLRLLLDEQDAYVTLRASYALLDRGDGAALRIYLKGYHLAEDRQRDWFHLPSWLPPRQRTIVDELGADQDRDVASAARTLISRVDAEDTRLVAAGWRK